MRLPQDTLTPAGQPPEVKTVFVAQLFVPLFCFMILIAPPTIYFVAASEFVGARGFFGSRGSTI
jgi:hypothetical protein